MCWLHICYWQPEEKNEPWQKPTNYWDTCGSPVIKCLCFGFFFPPPQKGENCAIVPSGHWALNTMTTNCDPMRVKVFTCWSRVILMMIDVVMHGQVRVTWRTRDFCLENSFVGRFVFQRVWITITWSIIAQTLEILTDAYTSRIVRANPH